MPDTSQYHGKIMEKSNFPTIPRAKDSARVWEHLLRNVLGLGANGPIPLALQLAGISDVASLLCHFRFSDSEALRYPVSDGYQSSHQFLSGGEQGMICALVGFVHFRSDRHNPIGEREWGELTASEFQQFIFAGYMPWYYRSRSIDWDAWHQEIGTQLESQGVRVPTYAPLSVSVAHVLLESTDSEQEPERGEIDNLSELGSADVLLLESTDESDNLSEPGENNNSSAYEEHNNSFVFGEMDNSHPSDQPDNLYASDVLSTAFANLNSFMGSDSSGEATLDTQRGCVLGFEDPNSAMGRDSYGDATVDTRRSNVRRRRCRRYAPRKRSGTQKKGGSVLPNERTGTATKRRTTKEPANEDRSKQPLKFPVKRLIDSGTTEPATIVTPDRNFNLVFSKDKPATVSTAASQHSYVASDMPSAVTPDRFPGFSPGATSYDMPASAMEPATAKEATSLDMPAPSMEPETSKEAASSDKPVTSTGHVKANETGDPSMPAEIPKTDVDMPSLNIPASCMPCPEMADVATMPFKVLQLVFSIIMPWLEEI